MLDFLEQEQISRDLLEGIRESERCGASGVQLYAWNELNPFEITKEKIAEANTTP